MPKESTPERLFCDAARDYLLSFAGNGVTPDVLSQYLEPGDSLRLNNINHVYKRLLHSAQNANMKASVISGSMDGGLEALSPVLSSFEPGAVVARYGDDWEAILDDIVLKVKPNGQILRNRGSLWPLFCRSIVSGAGFLVQFRDSDAFYAWADRYDADAATRADLPILISRQVAGIGFALACDFVKEIGYSNYVKPDVHTKQILVGLDLVRNTVNDQTAFNAITTFARAAGLSPYHVDKLMWLVGSGYFYRHSDIGRIATNRDEFVMSQRYLFEKSV